MFLTERLTLEKATYLLNGSDTIYELLLGEFNVIKVCVTYVYALLHRKHNTELNMTHIADLNKKVGLCLPSSLEYKSA